METHSNSVITSSKGQNKLCHHKKSVAVSEVYGKGKGKGEGRIFQDKTQTIKHITQC